MRLGEREVGRWVDAARRASAVQGPRPSFGGRWLPLMVIGLSLGCGNAEGPTTDFSEKTACTSDDACVPQFPDISVCQEARCVAGTCKAQDKGDGGQCADATCEIAGFVAASTCQQGVCTAPKVESCDDGDVCTEDACENKGGCVHTFNSVACDDGDACTTGDICDAGTCTAGKSKVCDDQIPCTTDSCDKKTGACGVAPISGDVTVDCDDGNACTTDDACGVTTPGVCGGQAKLCDDGDGCTADTCDPQIGCTFTSKSGPCDDGDACTNADTCGPKGCAGVAIDVKTACDDSKSCTADTCDPKTGCTHNGLTGNLCDDGNQLTVKDTCDAGVCVPGKITGVFTCKVDADCKAADSKNLCKGVHSCDVSKGTCVINSATVTPPCDVSKDGTCLKTACDPNSGKCIGTPAKDGASCDADGSLCTTLDACKSGLCTAGSVLICDDKNPCTNDSCDPKKGCLAIPNTAPCDDGDACTTKDACAGTTCTGGLAKGCDDGNPCTVDSCEKTSGCVAKPQGGGCDDGDACTTSDQCSGGACGPGKAKLCDDGKTCTLDVCDSKTGSCSAKIGAAASGLDGKICDDGNPCTSANVCKNGACQGGSAKTCDDGKKCTADSCDAKAGCVFAPIEGCNDCSGKPICTGETAPAWQLKDINPSSPTFGKPLGVANFKGQPLVMISVHGY